MHIGIPKEIKIAEKRVALTPQSCAELICEGHSIHIETEAGSTAGYENTQYTDVGCIIEDGEKNLYASSKLIVKVKEPLDGDLKYLTKDHTLFCYLHLASAPDLVEKLKQIGLTAYSYETVVVDGKTPLLAPMSAIAGREAVIIGSWYLRSTCGGRGTLLGGTTGHKAGKVVVVGGGVAGTESAILAHGMGADVVMLDINQQRLEELRQQLPGIQTGLSSKQSISNHIKDADLVVGAVYVVGRKAPQVITREHIESMEKGSVIVDISIDQGGCVEGIRPCTHDEPIYIKNGVIHSAITNLPAAAARTASQALSKEILPYVLQLANGTVNQAIEQAVNVQKGELKIKL